MASTDDWGRRVEVFFGKKMRHPLGQQHEPIDEANLEYALPPTTIKARSTLVQTRSNEQGRRKKLLGTILIIALGAALGANLRYFLTLRTAAWLGTGFPYGTLIINISGSFLIGLVYTLLANSGSPYTTELRLFLGVGLLGGYTTFSSFSYETYQLFLTGSTLLGLLNPLISVAGGLVASSVGIILGSIVSGRG